ncbi:hypothetical protein GCM10027280_43060 [Micromonospora polyrhachis]
MALSTPSSPVVDLVGADDAGDAATTSATAVDASSIPVAATSLTTRFHRGLSLDKSSQLSLRGEEKIRAHS